jgi:outer membrane autotransporter protein
LLPSSATVNERSVANALDGFTSRGGTLPLGLLGLFGLSPSDLATALTQGSGEAATAVPQAGAQAMNSFLSLVTNPFAGDRGVAPDDLQSPRRGLVYKAPVYKAANEIAPDPRNWEIWSAAYGVQNRTGGDVLAGSHDLSARAFGYVTGLDYRVTPYTAIGFALAGGGTTFGVSEGLGGGQSDMFQSAVYSLTRVDSTYVSAALAYAWQHVSTHRTLTVAATDTLTAEFSANNVGGRIEGGHGFKVPGIFGLPGFVFTPYAALQAQAFRTPSYSEVAASGSSNFALAYDALTTTTTRTELGAWFEPTIALENGATLTLRTRAAWAYDHWSDTNVNAAFQSLPGSSFTVIGAAPMRDSLLSSAGPQISFRNGISLAGWFESDLSRRSQTYDGTARLRYVW